MSNLIIAAAVNYTISDLRNFIYSAKSCCNADIAVIAQNLNSETRQWLRSNNIILFDHKIASIPIYISRYYGYKKALLSLQNYDTVFLTDSRDVIFQDDIFDRVLTEGLLVFEESYFTKICECEHNSKWLKCLYDDHVFELYKNKVILCSGTTLGSRAAIEVYLEEMIKQVEYAVSRKIFVVGIDQGMHNFLYYSNLLLEKLVQNGGNCRLMRNGDIVLTAERVYEFRFNKNQLIINEDGSLPAVIHQYDRHTLLKDIFNARFRRFEQTA